MDYSESSNETGDDIRQFEFVEGLDPAFSEHSLLTDTSTLTLSFALEPTVENQNHSHSLGTTKMDVRGHKVETHDPRLPPRLTVDPLSRRKKNCCVN